MKGSKVLLGVIVAALVILAAYVGTRPGDPSETGGPKGSGPTGSPGPASPTKGPSPSVVSGDPTADPGERGSISLENLTSGQISKEGSALSRSTSAVTVPEHSLVLVHLMSCCDHASTPTVTGAGLTFDLAVTHTEGEKRHWVFAAANAGGKTQGALTFSFESGQDRVMWIVDAARNVELGDGGGAAIVQSAWQNSMPNADNGAIALSPFEDPVHNAAVVFAIAGSGTATDIEPEPGTSETAEADVAGSSLLIDTFWRVGEDLSLAATFKDETGKLAVESWLFLAIELRAAS